MIAPRARILAVWSLSIVAALWLVVHARYVTDLSAFLPAQPTAMQRLLVDQLRDGPASRLILIALEGGDAKARAAVSSAMAGHLSTDRQFSNVENGAATTAKRDFEFIFRHRYLLSDAVTPQQFSSSGLHAAIAGTIEDLASSGGMLTKSLVPADPTGETQHVIEQLTRMQGPSTRDGVWISKDGVRTLLVAQTAAIGSDTDAQERALDAVRAAFVDATAHTGAAQPSNAAQPGGAARPVDATGRSTAIRLRVSGPGVFAVEARARIKRAATRLSVVSSVLVVGVLLVVYRSLPALFLGLLPVASGALAGIAAVALGFGAIHGITLGFGITLIGESVDYSIYFFILSQRGAATARDPAPWQRELWPTVRLGVLTSVCGFASLLPAGFPGLAQLGLYSISGLVAAALVTRFVLPALLPRNFAIHDVTPLGVRLERWRQVVRGRGIGVAVAGFLTVGATVLLYQHRDTLWNHELSALAPIPLEEQRYDATLRADLGAADVLDLIVVSGASLEAVLQGAEQVGDSLRPLIDAQVIGDFDSPTQYLPSAATQRARRDALPDRSTLQRRLEIATADLALESDALGPFLDATDAARHAPLLLAEELRGTSMDAGFAALVLHRAERWSALLPLHAPTVSGAAILPGSTAAAPTAPGAVGPAVDLSRVASALAESHADAQILAMKAETDALYASYLHEAMRLSAAGLALIVLLLLGTLRSLTRTLRVLLPLILAAIVVAAGLAVCGQELTLLHLVGMLLIVAVGSNYALFFDAWNRHSPNHAAPLTLASLGIANSCTVLGFGLLSFSQVPVLVALGTTVAPGAFLALVFSALLTSPPHASSPQATFA